MKQHLGSILGCHDLVKVRFSHSGFPPLQGLRAGGTWPPRDLAAHPSCSVEGRRAETETAATRQCPAFTGASANHRPAPSGPARRHRPRSGRRKTWPPGGSLRPSRGRAPRSDCAPPGTGGPGRQAPRRPPGQGSRTEGRARRPLWLERGAVPLRRASSRAEERVGGPAAGGSDIRATGLATTTAPWAAPSPCGTPGWPRLGGRCRGLRGLSAPREHPSPGAPCRRPLPPRCRLAPDAWARHAGHGRFALGAAPRARPRWARPTSCACTGGGAPRRQPISVGRPGTASEVLAGGGAGGRTS